MVLFGKYSLRLSRLRRALSLFAVLGTLVLIAGPVLAGPDETLTAPARNDQPNPPGEDPEDVVPDSLPHHSLAPSGPGRPVTGDTRHERWVLPVPPRAHFARTDRTVPIDPSGTGMGVRLRC